MAKQADAIASALAQLGRHVTFHDEPQRDAFYATVATIGDPDATDDEPEAADDTKAKASR